MADYGFPDFEKALEIYPSVNPDALRPAGDDSRGAPQEISDEIRPPFYVMSRQEGPFFSSILSKLSDSMEQNRIKEELAVLCNKAMVAEPMDLFSPDEMERVVKKVHHYLNLGLEYLSGGEAEKALEILQSLPLQKVFQSGVGATLLLRKKAEAILKGPWFEGDRQRLSFLDPDDRNRFEGVLRRRPGMDRHGVLEDFKNLQDVKGTERFLDRIAIVVTTLGETLKITPEGLGRLDLRGCSPEGCHDLTFSTLFLTSLANRILRGSFRVEAITKGELKEVFALVFEGDEQGKRKVKMEIRRDLGEWVRSTEPDEEKQQHLLAFWDFCLHLIEGEYGRIPPGEEIDSRFVKGLMIRE